MPHLTKKSSLLRFADVSKLTQFCVQFYKTVHRISELNQSFQAATFKQLSVFCQQQFVFLIGAITQFTWWHPSASAAITLGGSGKKFGQSLVWLSRLPSADQVIAKPTLLFVLRPGPPFKEALMPHHSYRCGPYHLHQVP